jgi:deoxyribose-phosphate aldolase
LTIPIWNEFVSIDITFHINKGLPPGDQVADLSGIPPTLNLPVITNNPPTAITMSKPNTITVNLPQLAKMIDHSLLHPTMTDEDILAGLKIAKDYNVATACVKPYLIPLAKQELDGTDVKICPVIGFPHGNSTTEIKVLEATAAAQAGGQEIDMVVNIGKVLGGDWEYVTREIEQINTAVVKYGAILKVIFENDYLQPEHIVRLCTICTGLKVAFVKTSSGYGFVKQADGSYNYKGATIPHLKLMRQHSGPEVQIKAAGGVRTLDDLLHVMSLGVTRIGATATIAIIEDAKRRAIGMDPVQIEFRPMKEEGQVGGY